MRASVGDGDCADSAPSLAASFHAHSSRLARLAAARCFRPVIGVRRWAAALFRHLLHAAFAPRPHTDDQTEAS